MNRSIPDPTDLLRGEGHPEQAAGGAYGCPRCGRRAPRTTYATRDYACPACGLVVAHLERAPNGSVRRVLGWLRRPGDLLEGRYRIVTLLGKGGFAATYAVEDLRVSGKRRALKEIPEQLFDERESEILSRLHHTGIPDIMDRFVADEMVYLTLEFAGTRTLDSERVSHGGSVRLGLLLAWMRELCDVLAYLHRQDPPVVHRDLKPENVLLNDDGRVMLIDFGIAKESDESGATRTLALSASHGFSPPEQVLGTGTDERSDVYALAATLYALLTGQKPTPAHERVAGQPLPPARELNPDVPEALDALLEKSLDLNIQRRVQSIERFAEILDGVMAAPAPETASELGSATVVLGEGALSASTPALRTTPAKARAGAPRWLAAAASGVAAALAVALLAWTLLAPEPSEPQAPAPSALSPPDGASASEPFAAAPVAPVVAVPPAPRPPGRSAAEILQAHRDSSVVDPAGREEPQATPAPSVQEATTVGKKRTARAEPAPPAATKPSGWQLEREGSYRTD